MNVEGDLEIAIYVCSSPLEQSLNIILKNEFPFVTTLLAVFVYNYIYKLLPFHCNC